MRKYLSGILSITGAVSLAVLQSFTAVSKDDTNSIDTQYSWYLVGSENRISSTTSIFNNMTKADVISTGSVCRDQVLPNCLFGTNGTVVIGQDVSAQPAAQRIRESY